jgi:sugar O-acyltransferase (sialic acid O-acetyltransferase NeuD family)
MTSPVFVMGGGGHGLVVLDALQASGIRVAGVLDPGLPEGSQRLGVPVLGGDEILDSVCTDCEVAVGVGVAGGLASRVAAFDRLLERGIRLATVVHPLAVLGRAVDLGAGCQVMAGAVVQVGTVVCTGAVVNTRASIDHEVRLEAYAFISPGAILCGGVVVGTGAFVGAGATVLPGVILGQRAIVGAGAVVLADVAAGTVVVGNPARELRKALHK